LVDQAPDGLEWLHELKFDGYRMYARLDGGAVRLLTRTGLDWTRKYPAIAAAVEALPMRQAYLGGELCGVRPDGTTSPMKLVSLVLINSTPDPSMIRISSANLTRSRRGETPSRSAPTHQIEPSSFLLPTDSCMTSRAATVRTTR
jgi:ATP dependent DNA ligase domain